MTWVPRARPATPKQVQRLLALPETVVVRVVDGVERELPVGTRAAHWQRVLPQVRAGSLEVQVSDGPDGAVRVRFG